MGAKASPIGSSIVALAVLACSPSAPSPREERTAQTSAAILAGSESPASDDAVVLLVWSPPGTTRVGICTAALVAPRLLLTARHCVSETDVDVGCAADGRAVIGGSIKENHAPADLYVFAGKARPSLRAPLTPTAKVAEIIDDGAKNLCDHDLALALLDRPIEGVPLASIRLDRPLTAGARLTTIGWGVTSSTLEPAVRQRRSGVVVTRVGPDPTSPVLTPNEILFGESICLGDSGGPILDEVTGAIVGVVSRGGNGTDSELDLASTCTAATNLATKIPPFEPLITGAFARAGAEPRREIVPEEDAGCRAAKRATGEGSPARGGVWLVALLGAALAWRRRDMTVDR
ncbi:MAG: trypsin-like serine protease [Labilithrix sp.]|nr:trypsin-like serine protease [Labilithrix sp.]